MLEETRDIDAASDESGDDDSEEDSDDEEDETAELLRELEKIKRERAEKKEQEEKEKAAAEQDQREKGIALGNPLLMPNKDPGKKRRYVFHGVHRVELGISAHRRADGTTTSYSKIKPGVRRIRARRNSLM